MFCVIEPTTYGSKKLDEIDLLMLLVLPSLYIRVRRRAVLPESRRQGQPGLALCRPCASAVRRGMAGLVLPAFRIEPVGGVGDVLAAVALPVGGGPRPIDRRKYLREERRARPEPGPDFLRKTFRFLSGVGFPELRKRRIFRPRGHRRACPGFGPAFRFCFSFCFVSASVSVCS